MMLLRPKLAVSELVLLIVLALASITTEEFVITSADFASSFIVAYQIGFRSEDLAHPYSCPTSGSSLDSYSLGIATAASAIASSFIAGAFVRREGLHTLAVDGHMVEHQTVLLAFALSFNFLTFVACNLGSCPGYFDLHYHSSHRRSH